MSVIGAKETGVARVAVIGAGSMGGGIAAQFANAGIPVDLLDMAGEGNRNAPAETGLARQLKAGGFMDPSAAANVTCGNIDDHLDRLSQADWIVEAVIEDLAIKQDLFRKIETVRKPGCILSSNTSTIPRADLIAGMGERFARDFVITHFFNPPRVMQLVEIVTAPETDPKIDRDVHAAARALLGKTVVDCRDTPGFIANRIGCFWMAAAALEAKRLGLTVELADAVNAALGIPRTGVFGLFDLVGIDLVPHVWGSLMASLPDDDALQGFDLPGDPTFRALIDAGRFGRKAGAGFYRKAQDGSREALDLATGDYRPAEKPDLPGGGRDLKALLADTGPAGTYAKALLEAVIGYASDHAADLADDPAAIDTAVELGYSWRQGPFKLASATGLFPQAPKGVEAGSGGVSALPLLFGNDCASVHDMGDGVACFRMHTKMNSFHPDVFEVLDWAVTNAGHAFDALVLGNDDPRAFSVGADLSFILSMIDTGGTTALGDYIRRGQTLFLALRRCPVPVVAAVHGFALGGGCELSLHADTVIAHAGANMGLPETKVGLIPAWGGCTTLLARSQARGGGPVMEARRAFDAILPGTIFGSALQAKSVGVLRAGDGIVMHRGDLLPAAKARALAMIDGYTPPEPVFLTVGGPSAKAGVMAALSAEMHAGRITGTDHMMADVLADILTGGPDADMTRMMTEEEVMALERAALVDLVTRPTTRDRMDHMLKTGKPLRN